jgi:hypothetical protein
MNDSDFNNWCSDNWASMNEIERETAFALGFKLCLLKKGVGGNSNFPKNFGNLSPTPTFLISSSQSKTTSQQCHKVVQ